MTKIRFIEEQMRDYSKEYGSSVLPLIQEKRFNAAKAHAILATKWAYAVIGRPSCETRKIRLNQFTPINL